MRASELTVGILAGGQASRLGGLDKAWLQHAGEPLVARAARRHGTRAAAVLVSANRALERYAAAGLAAVPDRVSGRAGPLAGIDALLARCGTPWLLTLPVDALHVPAELVDRLAAAAAECDGAYAYDADGRQPLVALYRVDLARAAAADALQRGRLAVHAFQDSLQMVAVGCDATRFGNLNTLADLAAAGIAPDSLSTDDGTP